MCFTSQSAVQNWKVTSFCTFYHLQDGDKTTDPISNDILEISEHCLRYSTDKASHIQEGQQV